MWKKVKLGDVCDVLDKLRKPVTKKHRVSGDIPYYGATGVVDWVADFIFNEKLVLVGEDGAKWGAGDATAFIVDGKTWVNNHAHVLRPHDGTLLHEWLAYYLTAIDLSPWVTGLTVPKLNQAQLRSIPIPLPPLAEQQRIVAKLDAAFAEIDRAVEVAEAKQQQTQRLQSAALASIMVASEWKTDLLGDICDFQGGSQPPKKEFLHEPREGYVRFIQIRDFKSDKNITYIPVSKKNRLCQEDDILIGRYGASVGQILRGLAGAYNVALMKTKPNKTIISKGWLYAYLNSPLFQQPLMRASSRSAQNGFSKNDISSFEVPLPPLEEQKNLIARLDEIFEQIDIARDAFNSGKRQYAALKSAILAQELQPPHIEAA